MEKLMSVREVTRKYNEIVKYYEGEDIDLANRVNNYRCPKGHITKTKDVDKGVTPFMRQCGKDGCEEFGRSSFYNDNYPAMQPTQEWFRPSLKQVIKMRKNAAMLEHVLQGGLEVRNIKSDE